MTLMKRIPVAGPWITEKEVAYVADAAATGWYERAGDYPRRFEQALADRVGVKYAVALPHCTSALHLALAALGVGPGDEVIVPEITWIATAAPIQYVGATPVFADIDPITWCLTAESVQRVMTEKTKAVIAVDLYGGMPDYGRLQGLCGEWDIALVEDAAQAIGAASGGKAAGSFGVAGTFSFHGSKTLTTGEGGMLVTNDEALHREVLFLRDHGRAPGDKLFLNSKVAFKYRMSAVQAALGLGQAERLDALTDKKREIFDWYRIALAGIPGLSLNAEPAGTKNTYWMVTPVWEASYGIEKFEMMRKLSEAGIESRPFFAPLSSLPAYAGTPAAVAGARDNRVAYSLSARAINLPSALCLTREDVEQVSRAFKAILGLEKPALAEAR